MTTIAYRDGIMAADTQGNRGGIRSVTRKLHRIDNRIVGFSGNYQDGLTFVAWVRDGMKMDALPEFRGYGRTDDAPDINALVLSPDGLVQWTEHFQPMPITEPFFAIGSGFVSAMTAMHMGASAAKAVEIAMLIDVETGGEIQVERCEEWRVAVA